MIEAAKKPLYYYPECITRSRAMRRSVSKRRRRDSRCSIPAAIMQTEDEGGILVMSWHDVMYQEGDGYEQ